MMNASARNYQSIVMYSLQFQALNISVTHVESRPSKDPIKYDFFVQCESKTGSNKSLMSNLHKVAENVRLHKEEITPRGKNIFEKYDYA